MSLIGGIIYAVMAALAAGMIVAYLYERERREEAQEARERLEGELQETEAEICRLREELARLNGISQGRECDAMQREFLKTLQQNGQGTMRIARRQDA